LLSPDGQAVIIAAFLGSIWINSIGTLDGRSLDLWEVDGYVVVASVGSEIPVNNMAPSVRAEHNLLLDLRDTNFIIIFLLWIY